MEPTTMAPCDECDKDNADLYTRSLRHFNLRDEVYKLKLLLIGKNDPIYRVYVEEKINTILNKLPISLSGNKIGIFNDWKRIEIAKQYRQ